MKASIIIPTKNGGSRFERVLKAIFENSLDGGFEVIVIDSGSTDRTLDIARRYPVRLYEIPPHEFGHGKVRNYGARLSEAEFLIFLSQDAIPAFNNWLSSLIASFNNDINIAGVYGKQLPDGDNPMETFFLLNTYGERYKVKSLPSHTDTPSFREIFFSNVNSAIRKRVWDDIPLSESVNMSEDQEWSKQALLAGYKIAYIPDAAVYHSHNYGIISIFKRNYESGFSLRGLVKESVGQVLKETVSYLMKEVAYVIKTSGLTMVPYLLIYELSRHLGFVAGSIVAGIKKKVR